jgi:hypothetical protein
MTIRDSADEVLQFIDYAKCKELNPDFEVFKSKIIKHLLNADLIPKKDND